MSWKDKLSSIVGTDNIQLDPNQAKEPGHIKNNHQAVSNTKFDCVSLSVSNELELKEILEEANRSGAFVLTGEKKRLLPHICSAKQRLEKIIFLDLSPLDKIVEHTKEDQVISVQTGHKIRNLNDYLAKTKQWLPVTGRHEDSTLLEIIETGSGGPLDTGYGGPRNLVLGLQSSLANGNTIKTGGKIVKNVTGYDLTKMLVGSRSSIGISHLVHLRLYAKPEHSKSLVIPFKGTNALPELSASLLSSGLPIAALEIIDKNFVGIWTKSDPDKYNCRQYQKVFQQFESFYGQKDLSSKSLATGYIILSLNGQLEEIEESVKTLESKLSHFQFSHNCNSTDQLVLDSAETDLVISALSETESLYDLKVFSITLPHNLVTTVLENISSPIPWMIRPKTGRLAFLFDAESIKYIPFLRDEIEKILKKNTNQTQLKSSVCFSYPTEEFEYLVNYLERENSNYLDSLKSSIKLKFDPNGQFNPLVRF